MELTEKAAYIKGLMDGMQLDETNDQNRILRAMSDLLCEITAVVSDLDADMTSVYEQVDLISDIMDDLCGVEDDDEEDDDPDEYDYELTCPKCGTVNYVDEETLLNEQVYCANCGAAFSIEFEDDEEGEDEAAPSED